MGESRIMCCYRNNALRSSSRCSCCCGCCGCGCRLRLRPHQRLWMLRLQRHGLGLRLRLEPWFRLRPGFFLLGVGPLVPLWQRMRSGRGGSQLWMDSCRGSPNPQMRPGGGIPELLELTLIAMPSSRTAYLPHIKESAAGRYSLRLSACRKSPAKAGVLRL